MLEKELPEILKQSMKDGLKVKVSVLRMVLSEIKNKKIEEGLKELTDDKVISLIQKMARQHKESIEQFKSGDRSDLVKKEEDELAVLEEYLPEQLSEDEVKKIVSEVIEATGAASPADMGGVMREVMARVAGRADGKVISALVKEKLSGTKKGE